MICDGLKVAVKCSSKMKNSNATSDSVNGSRLIAVVVVVVESVVVATVVEVIVVKVVVKCMCAVMKRALL